MMDMRDGGVVVRPALPDGGDKSCKTHRRASSKSDACMPATSRDTSTLSGKPFLIMKELMTTELDYVRDLQSLLSGYHGPMAASVPAQDLAALFGNLPELHDFHRELLNKLLHCNAESPRYVGECFTSMGERFLIYTQYYTNHPRAVQLLQERQEDPEFFRLMLDCQMKLGHMLPLGDYLLKPVQRLLKYPLLLRELLKATHECDAGHAELLAADNLMKKVAGKINEIKWKNEMVDFVDELQQHLVKWDGGSLQNYGQLLNAGELKVSDMVSKQRSDRYVVLFERALVMCKFHTNGMATVKHLFSVGTFQAMTVMRDPACFQITSNDSKSLSLFIHCRDADEKDAWMANIKQSLLGMVGLRLPPPTLTEASPCALRRFQRPTNMAESSAAKKKKMTPKKRTFSAGAPSTPLSPTYVRKTARRPNNYTLSDHDDVTSVKSEEGVTSPRFRRALRNTFRRASPNKSGSEILDVATTTTNSIKTSTATATAKSASAAAESEATPVVAAEEHAPLAVLPSSKSNSGNLVIRCSFPGSTHTSVVVKPHCTVGEVFESRLTKRGYSIEDCILRVVNTTSEQAAARVNVPIDWTADAHTALEGVTNVNVVKVKTSVPKVVFDNSSLPDTTATSTDDVFGADTGSEALPSAGCNGGTSPALALEAQQPELTSTLQQEHVSARSLHSSFLQAGDVEDEAPKIRLIQPSTELLCNLPPIQRSGDGDGHGGHGDQEEEDDNKIDEGHNNSNRNMLYHFEGEHAFSADESDYDMTDDEASSALDMFAGSTVACVAEEDQDVSECASQPPAPCCLVPLRQNSDLLRRRQVKNQSSSTVMDTVLRIRSDSHGSLTSSRTTSCVDTDVQSQTPTFTCPVYTRVGSREELLLMPAPILHARQDALDSPLHSASKPAAANDEESEPLSVHGRQGDLSRAIVGETVDNEYPCLSVNMDNGESSLHQRDSPASGAQATPTSTDAAVSLPANSTLAWEHGEPTSAAKILPQRPNTTEASQVQAMTAAEENLDAVQTNVAEKALSAMPQPNKASQPDSHPKWLEDAHTAMSAASRSRRPPPLNFCTPPELATPALTEVSTTGAQSYSGGSGVGSSVAHPKPNSAFASDVASIADALNTAFSRAASEHGSQPSLAVRGRAGSRPQTPSSSSLLASPTEPERRSSLVRDRVALFHAAQGSSGTGRGPSLSPSPSSSRPLSPAIASRVASMENGTSARTYLNMTTKDRSAATSHGRSATFSGPPTPPVLAGQTKTTDPRLPLDPSTTATDTAVTTDITSAPAHDGCQVKNPDTVPAQCASTVSPLTKSPVTPNGGAAAEGMLAVRDRVRSMETAPASRSTWSRMKTAVSGNNRSGPMRKLNDDSLGTSTSPTSSSVVSPSSIPVLVPLSPAADTKKGLRHESISESGLPKADESSVLSTVRGLVERFSQLSRGPSKIPTKKKLAEEEAKARLAVIVTEAKVVAATPAPARPRLQRKPSVNPMAVRQLSQDMSNAADAAVSPAPKQSQHLSAGEPLSHVDAKINASFSRKTSKGKLKSPAGAPTCPNSLSVPAVTGTKPSRRCGFSAQPPMPKSTPSQEASKAGQPLSSARSASVSSARRSHENLYGSINVRERTKIFEQTKEQKGNISPPPAQFLCPRHTDV